jgi:hypothetical protein
MGEKEEGSEDSGCNLQGWFWVSFVSALNPLACPLLSSSSVEGAEGAEGEEEEGEGEE